MKTRVLAAAALLPLLLIVLLVLPKVFTAILVGAFCAIAAYELLQGTKLVAELRLTIYTAIIAFLVSLWCTLTWTIRLRCWVCCFLWH